MATYIASTGLVQSGYENGKTPQTFEIFDVIGKAGMHPISISGLGNATFDGQRLLPSSSPMVILYLPISQDPTGYPQIHPL